VAVTAPTPQVRTTTAIRRHVVDRRDGSVRDYEFCVETTGNPNDIPVLLVMGLGAQMYLWPDEFVATLAGEGFFVIRFDNRDVGLSTKTLGDPPEVAELLRAQVGLLRPKVAYLLGDMADDAFAVLDHLGINQAHIAGASMGGMIAQSMAIAAPDRVLSLTSIMSTTGNRRVGRAKPAFLLRMMKLIGDRERGSSGGQDAAISVGVEITRLTAGAHFDRQRTLELQTRLVQRSYHPAGARFQTAAIAASPDRTDALRQLDVPALVVHGAMDRLVPISGGRATASALRGSRYLVFDDMGHDLPPGRGLELVAAIRDVIARGEHRSSGSGSRLVSLG
jgi:pimeloyl-ACP methyl ester carboxylesterase